MEKRDVAAYLYLGILVAVAIVAVYYFNLGPTTGFAVLNQYTSEADCVGAGYTWENITNETCTDISGCTECEENCVESYTEVLCTAGCQADCTNISNCIVCETGCVPEYTEVLCTAGCQESCAN